MALVLNSGFTIVNVAYVHYEEMSVEIKYGHSYFLEINRETKPNLLEVVLHNQKVFGYIGTDLQFSLDDFLFAVERAKEILINFGFPNASEVNTLIINESPFEVSCVKGINREDVIAEISYEGESIIRLNLDGRKNGGINTQILTKYVEKGDLSWPTFPLDDFVKTLKKAKALLLNLSN
jgi:hypothetical protein